MLNLDLQISVLDVKHHSVHVLRGGLDAGDLQEGFLVAHLALLIYFHISSYIAGGSPCGITTRLSYAR